MLFLLRRNGAAMTLPYVTHMKSHLAGEVIHATGVHETQSVAHGLGTQDTLACNWTDASIGQSGSHYTSRLAGHLDGAKLRPKESQLSTLHNS